ncbi:DUF5682 family protein, partial [Nocardiopsis gilva]
AGVAGREDIPGRVGGRAHRILYDAGRLADTELAARLAKATSRAVPPERAAAWIEGFLSGSGLLLVHDTALLSLIDRWLTGLGEQAFTEVLPLLRRTFGAFPAAERRSIGERARGLGRGRSTAEATPDDIDTARAAPAVATVATLLGLPEKALARTGH